METVKKTRPAIYARLSRGDDASASVPEQVRRCQAEAERLGYGPVPDELIFRDENNSASKPGGKRPAYDQFVKAVKSGRVNAVLVRETSRLYRKPRELEDLIDLVEGTGFTVVPLFSSQQQLDGALERNDVFMARILVAKDAEESKAISKRVKIAKAVNRAAGRHSGGGRRPFGYVREPGNGLVVVPEEAALIRESIDRVLGGENLTRIVLDWNTRGIQTPGGGRWSRTQLARILTGRNEKNGAGTGTLRGTPLIAGGADWDTIASADEVALVTAAIDAAKPHQFADAPANDARPGARRYVLSGLVECSLCGTKMLGSSGYYRCMPINGGCGQVSVSARQLEDLLDRRVQQERETTGARDPEAADAVSGDPAERDAILAELADVNHRLDELATAIDDGSMSIALAGKAEAKLTARRTQAEARLAALMPEQAARSPYDFGTSEEAADWRARWEARELTAVEVADLHDTFAAYFSSIQVAPRDGRPKQLDPARIKVQWT